jgi:uncharacterized membrane protein YfcA
MIILYFFIAIIATTFGSLVGLGGGVVIKPVLDAIGSYDITTIGILSSFTVFSMAIVSTGKQLKKGFKVEHNMLLLTFGSIVGGWFGNSLFNIFLLKLNNDGMATAIQGGMLALLLTSVLFKEHYPKYHLKNGIIIVLTGIFLGTIASFLGIGGGPINVMALTLLLNMDIKKAAITSVLIILFSQLTKLLIVGLGSGFGSFDLSMLYVMIPGGIAGGFVGAHFNHKLTHEVIHKIFNVAIILLILLNIYNIINSVL